MSLIGTLEQFSLSTVLQRVEAFQKTGLLVLKQGTQWAEFYLRDGHLLCIGPLHTNASLGERLLLDGIISPVVLREVQLVLGAQEQSETQVALILMNMGFVGRDELRSWAIQQALMQLQPVLLWRSGEIYFEDGAPPPTDRLLASMPITTLLQSLPAAPAQVDPPVQAPPAPTRYPAQEDMQSARPVQRGMQDDVAKSVSQPLQADRIQQQMSPAAPIAPQVPQTPKLPPTPSAPSASVAAAQMPRAMYSTLAPDVVQEPTAQHFTATPTVQVSRVPTLMDASQFLDDSSQGSFFFATAVPTTEALEPDFAPQVYVPDFNGDQETDFAASLLGGDDSNGGGAQNGLAQPRPVAQPMQPRRIDTSFMRPDMILYPVDLSSNRERNPEIQITPDQWRVLTQVDGQTSLQEACLVLSMVPELVCQVAGELVAEGLIQVALPEQSQRYEQGGPLPDNAAPGMSTGYVAPGYNATVGSPWSASIPGLPLADVAAQYAPVAAAQESPMSAPHFPSSLPFETQSQWGNGGNGATFIPGRGWIATPQPMQPLHSNSSFSNSYNGAYAQMGSNGSY